MIKQISILLLASCLILSCKKSKDDSPEPTPPADNGNTGSGITQVPGSFTQKVLLETFVGAWCSTCPDADTKRDQVVNANSNKVIAVSVHQTDGMSIPLFNTLYNNFSPNTPSGMVNRTPSLGNVILNSSQWMSNTTVALGKTAKCGLALTSTITNGNADIEIHASFKETLAGNYNLMVYLVEDTVTGSGSGYDQMNAYNNSSGSPYYNQGNPIVGYHHNRVVRKVLTADMGDAIPANYLVAGGDYSKTFTAGSLSMYNQNYLFVVAFVNKLGISSTTHEIMNVQSAKIGTLKNWD